MGSVLEEEVDDAYAFLVAMSPYESLTPEAVAALEAAQLAAPQDLLARARLIGAYERTQLSLAREHALWLIEHAPTSAVMTPLAALFLREKSLRADGLASWTKVLAALTAADDPRL